MTKLWNLITLKNVRPRLKWMILIVPFLCSLPIFLWMIVSTMDSLRLFSEGTEVQGFVLNKYIEQDDNDGNNSSYYIEYEFDAGLGDPPDFISDTEPVSQSTYEAYYPSESIPVTFLYEKPWVSSVDPQRYYENSFIFLACIGTWVLLLGIVVTINVVVSLRRSAVSRQ